MVVVAQLGARMHYAVPAILERSGMLERLYTDIYAPPLPASLGKLAVRYGPRAVRRWFGRVSSDIAPEKVFSFPAMGLEYVVRQKRASSNGSVAKAHLWAGKELCRRAIGRGLGSARCVYTYNSAGLELLQYAREHGIYAITEQTCAPSRIYEGILDEERQLYPHWDLPGQQESLKREFDVRELAEWQMADLIVCASDYVRDGIQASGGPVGKCCVVPYGVSMPSGNQTSERQQSRPLHVLMVGTVSLRKGIPYVLAAARALRGKAEFHVAGKIDMGLEAQKLLGEHVELLGAIPRLAVHRQFEWADVFLLPTLCEGSATVCYEALAHGLPVITTPNAGSVVRDGIDGFIVPIRDAAAIVDRIERLIDDEDRWGRMSAQARSRAAEYTVERYGERLLDAFRYAGLATNGQADCSSRKGAPCSR